MGRRSSRCHRSLLSALCVGTLVTAATACDTGDGRTLTEPEFPLPAPQASEPPPTAESTLPAEPTTVPAAQVVAPWPDGAAIPARHTCDGDDVSPALTWSGLPLYTVEVAVTVTDLDASGFVHWLVVGLPPSTAGLVEGQVPDAAIEWWNSFGRPGWGGPCPPAGEEHRYVFTVHALNQQVEVAENASTREVIEFLNATTITTGSVSGTYARSG